MYALRYPAVMQLRDLPEFAVTWILAAAHVALALIFLYWLGVLVLGWLGLA